MEAVAIALPEAPKPTPNAAELHRRTQQPDTSHEAQRPTPPHKIATLDGAPDLPDADAVLLRVGRDFLHELAELAREYNAAYAEEAETNSAEATWMRDSVLIDAGLLVIPSPHMTKHFDLQAIVRQQINADYK